VNGSNKNAVFLFGIIFAVIIGLIIWKILKQWNEDYKEERKILNDPSTFEYENLLLNTH